MESESFVFTAGARRVLREIEERLSSKQEEADTKMILHLSSIMDPANVAIRASDTDVLAIALGNIDNIKNGVHVFLEVGLSSKNILLFVDATILICQLGVPRQSKHRRQHSLVTTRWQSKNGRWAGRSNTFLEMLSAIELSEPPILEPVLEKIKISDAMDPIRVELRELVLRGFQNDMSNLPNCMSLKDTIRHWLTIEENEGMIVIGSRIVVPSALRQDVTNDKVEMCQGATNLRQRARLAVYWQPMDIDITNTAPGCTDCLERQSSQPPWSNANQRLCHSNSSTHTVANAMVTISSFSLTNFTVDRMSSLSLTKNSLIRLIALSRYSGRSSPTSEHQWNCELTISWVPPISKTSYSRRSA